MLVKNGGIFPATDYASLRTARYETFTSGKTPVLVSPFLRQGFEWASDHTHHHHGFTLHAGGRQCWKYSGVHLLLDAIG